MVKLSKPTDGNHGSLRDKFPILSSLSEDTANGNERHTHKPRTQGRSKSIFFLAQKFFRLSAEDDASDASDASNQVLVTKHAMDPSSSSSDPSSDDQHSIKAMNHRDAAYYHPNNNRRVTPTATIPPKEQKSWNPLASIRGKLDAGFFSVRGRSGPAMRSHVSTDFHSTAESPLKRRKSLRGLHNAWGTVGKKFTLKGRSRAQAQADLKAYQMQDEDDAIAMNDFGATEHVKDIYRHALSLPSEGLSTSNRRAGSSSDSSTTSGSKGRKTPEPEQIEAYINVKKTTNGRKAFNEDRGSTESSFLPVPLAPANTRTSEKHVVFLSATQVKLMEEAKQRRREASNSSSASGCPSMGSRAQNSMEELPLPSPALPFPSPVTRTASFYDKTLTDKHAEIKLMENILSETCSLDSVDLDASFENRRTLRQARYNLLMDPVQQVKNYEIYTKSVENAVRMLKNIGHPDIDNFKNRLSFDGPLYTWTDASKVTKEDVDVATRFKLVVDSEPLEGVDGKALLFKPRGDSKVEICNDYNNIVITTTELEENSAPTTPRKGVTASAVKAGAERGRSLSRTPTKNLAVNNRSERNTSPLKRFKLTPNNSYNRFMNNGSPSSTAAVRWPSRASSTTSIEVEHIEDVESDTFDLSYLSLADTNTRGDAARDSISSAVSADLAAFQAEEDRKFRRPEEKELSDDTVEMFVTAMSSGHASGFSETSGIVTPPMEMAPVSGTSSPRRPRSGAASLQRPSPSAKEIEEEFKAFQAEYVAKYTKPASPSKQPEKKEHWAEGRILSTWNFMAKHGPIGQPVERSTSFIFVANGKRIRMATFGPSSFFATTSCSPMEARKHGELIGPISNRMGNKGKEKAHTFEDEDVFGKSSNNSSYWGKRQSMVMDDDFHPPPCFNVQPAIGSSSSGAASPPMYNAYGNIVNVWTPGHQHGLDIHHPHPMSIGDRYFDALQWPPATQDIFRQNYPIKPPGPRSPEQATGQSSRPEASPTRNVDSGYWDAEKASEASRAVSGSSVYSEQPPTIEVTIPSSPASPEMVTPLEEQDSDRLFVLKTTTSPHGTAAHILARLDEGRYKSIAVDDEMDLRSLGMDEEYAANSSAAKIEAKLNDHSLTEQQKHDFAGSKHDRLMKKIKPGKEPAGQYRSAAPSPESFTGKAEEGLRFEDFGVKADFDGSSTAAEVLKRLDTIEAALEHTQIEDGLIPSTTHAEYPEVGAEDGASFYNFGKEMPIGSSRATRNSTSVAEQESNMLFERARALTVMKNTLETAVEKAEEGLELERMAKLNTIFNWPAVGSEYARIGTCMPLPADKAQQSVTGATAAMLSMAFEQRMGEAKAAAYAKLEALQADRWQLMEIKASKEWSALQDLANFHTLVNFETRVSERPKIRSCVPFPRTPRVLRGNSFKAKSQPVAERENSPNWKGKSQAWPTFIAFEPVTTQYKEKKTPPALPPRNLMPQTSHARNITPQATINASLGRAGPISPLTKAWLESKKMVDKTDYFPDASTPGEPSWYPGSLRGRQLMPHSGNERTVSGNSIAVKGGLAWNRAVSGGVEPIRGIRPSMCMADRTVSGMSVATAVDDSFGEELVDFRSEITDKGMKEGEMGEGKGKRVASWMLYG